MPALALRGELDRKTKKAMDRLVDAGFDYTQFSPYHFRIENLAEFWPTSGRWRFVGRNLDGTGVGSLIEELNKTLNPHEELRND